MKENPWALFYISCRYPAVMIPILVELNEECWKIVTQDLIKLFPRPYCSILQTQFEVLKTMVASQEVNESNFNQQKIVILNVHLVLRV